MEKSLEEVLDELKDSLMRLPSVNGVGIVEAVLPNGEVGEFIQVTVNEKVPVANLKPSERIPKKINGVEVVVREIGPISPEG